MTVYYNEIDPYAAHWLRNLRAPGRVGGLRAYGNAINAEAAAHFIAAYLETL